MKRWLLAIPVLLGGCVGFASADYLVIVANLGPSVVKPQFPVPGGGITGISGGPMIPGGGLGVPTPPPPRPEDMVVDPDAAPFFVTEIVEIANLKKEEVAAFYGKPGFVEVHGKWGAAYVTPSTINPVNPPKLEYGARIITAIPGISARYEEEYKKIYNGKDKPSTAQVVTLAQWTLEHGLLVKFGELMDSLAKDDKDNKIVASYMAVKAALEAPLSEGMPAAHAKLFDGFKHTARPNDHYVVYHKSPTDDPIEVKSRLDLLEQTFRGFYYWYALKGIALPLPRERLTAVITNKKDDFNNLHAMLTSGPVVADGFFARRENVAVFSAKRLDEKYDALEQMANPVWATGVNRNDILNPKKWPRVRPEVLVGPQMMALLLKTMEVDSERAGISHDGTRQLLFAAGLLPKNVAAPEWLQFGMGSFFETPLGSPWVTTAAPNPEQLPNFNDYRKLKRFEKTPGATLRKVVTDSYFREAALNKDSALERKARASAWALTYFLMEARTNNLQRYYRELSKLPRDVEIDDATLLGCFARAFDLVDSGKNVDARKFDELGTAWYEYLNSTTLEQGDELQKIRQFISNATKDRSKETPPGGAPVPPNGRP